MRKAFIIPIVAIIIGTGIGLGVYFWFNPLGSTYQNLAPGTIILKGTFVGFDSGHYGSGTVQFVIISGGDLELQFVEVDIANGPDLYIYLSDKATFSGTTDDPGNYINLGLLPYNSGNFSILIYENINSINSVLIWCQQYSVAFTYATLS